MSLLVKFIHLFFYSNTKYSKPGDLPRKEVGLAEALKAQEQQGIGKHHRVDVILAGVNVIELT